MRYMARRILSGEWLTRDLVLTDVERTMALSGPGTITGNLAPETNSELWPSDSLRLAEDWATMVYAVDDNGDIANHGIVQPPTSYEDATRITCAGVARYPNGYIFNSSRLWGPQALDPVLPRPDPVAIFHDHWEWIQQQESSNLDVITDGDLTTGGLVLIGTNAEPYRLRQWDVPDLGAEMETLAQITPFDFVESARWTDATWADVEHKITVGYPRLGRRRDDLRFAMGENVALQPSVQTIENAANHLIGLGNGEAGPSMVYEEMPWVDGRLRRTRVVTDKTASTAVMKRRLLIHREALNQRYDVTQVAVIDHPNAPLSGIELGDDIRVQADHEEFGPIDMWVRVLSITQGDAPDAAILTTSASTFFIYRPTEDIT